MTLLRIFLACLVAGLGMLTVYDGHVILGLVLVLAGGHLLGRLQ